MARTAREYQETIKTRVEITIPITVIIETHEETASAAKAEALLVLVNRLRPESVSYRWGSAIDDSIIGDPKFKMLELKPLPEPVEEVEE